MKKLLLPLFVLTQFVFADPPDWETEFDPWMYEFAMYMNVAVLSDVDGTIMGNYWGDMLAAFSEDGTVRGIGIPLEVPFGPYMGEIVWELTIFSNMDFGPEIHGKSCFFHCATSKLSFSELSRSW